MSSETVWVPDWEIECCGEPFAVGDRVRWDVETRRDQGEWLAQLLGTPLTLSTPLYYYTRHGGGSEWNDVPMQGIVTAITGVWESLDRSTSDPHLLLSVEGSGRTESKSRVAVASETSREPEHFIGWLVGLES